MGSGSRVIGNIGVIEDILAFWGLFTLNPIRVYRGYRSFIEVIGSLERGHIGGHHKMGFRVQGLGFQV